MWCRKCLKTPKKKTSTKFQLKLVQRQKKIFAQQNFGVGCLSSLWKFALHTKNCFEIELKASLFGGGGKWRLRWVKVWMAFWPRLAYCENAIETPQEKITHENSVVIHAAKYFPSTFKAAHIINIYLWKVACNFITFRSFPDFPVKVKVESVRAQEFTISILPLIQTLPPLQHLRVDLGATGGLELYTHFRLFIVEIEIHFMKISSSS